ncbi:DUF2202 domain-containing protein [uncultured Draconibacterium sp.]|uniref:DUF2202 domain-containing protein n=1 Tax=uncultured Draconibacterium sp. TaxID=1573823 RepID=UPI0029C89471|nr:DUF2202 domain-containing protein [uncultured Draconibacterium sp.]
MKTIRVFGLVAVMAMLFNACSESATDVADEEIMASEEVKSSEITALLGDSCNFSVVLNDEEIEGLLLMREEEKFAHDVYVTLYATHGLPVFNNISKSETAHTSAILYLINGFGLEDPYIEGVGNYTNETFKSLFAQLTGQGNGSVAEALKVGAFIEEYDIADLAELIESTENETLKRVYGNLLRGSTFHLRAFSAVLNGMGESYTPTVISQEEYGEILSGNSDDDNSDNSSTFVPGTGVCDGIGPNF